MTVLPWLAQVISLVGWPKLVKFFFFFFIPLQHTGHCGQNNHNLECTTVIWSVEPDTQGFVLYVHDRFAMGQAVHHIKDGLQRRCR